VAKDSPTEQFSLGRGYRNLGGLLSFVRSSFRGGDSLGLIGGVVGWRCARGDSLGSVREVFFGESNRGCFCLLVAIVVVDVFD